MTTAVSDLRLEIRRVIHAPIDAIYAAWTKPELMKQWMSPGPVQTGRVDADVRVGGRYAIEMLMPTGDVMNVAGTYVELVPGKKIVYTWKWAHEENESRVTVQLVAVADGTEVQLTHEGFGAGDRRDSHDKGWYGCLEKLATFAGRPHPKT